MKEKNNKMHQDAITMKKIARKETKIMNYLNVSKKVKDLERACFVKLEEYGAYKETNENIELILDETVSLEAVCDILQEILAVELIKNIFCWEENSLSRYSFKIGTREIAIVKGMSLDAVFEEIKTAIVIGLADLEAQSQYISFIKNNGFGICGTISDEYIEKSDITELTQWINSKTYCDEEFEEIIKSLGFEIYVGEHKELGEAKYIDVSCYSKDSKIWLQEGYKQHTLYRSVHPRARVEILYLLNALKFGEGIYSDEY